MQSTRYQRLQSSASAISSGCFGQSGTNISLGSMFFQLKDSFVSDCDRQCALRHGDQVLMAASANSVSDCEVRVSSTSVLFGSLRFDGSGDSKAKQPFGPSNGCFSFAWLLLQQL
jgi:hypothetical protein